MSWRHPDLSLQDLMKLVEGFVDILILLSGYQSSGRLAHWDPHNVNKAFRWALFFENFLASFSSSDDYVESVKDLEMAISQMKSAPSFPKGLAHMSIAILAKARCLVLEHIIHSLPLRDVHLRALLAVTVERDLDELSKYESDVLDVYIRKLKLEDRAVQEGIGAAGKFGDCDDDGLTKYAVKEILKRWSAVSLVGTVETGLDAVSRSVGYSSWSEFDDNLLKEQLKHESSLRTVDWLVGCLTWNRWKSVSLGYFLDKRTVQLVSGASMIFSTPKNQWIQIFQQLNFNDLAGGSDDVLCETIELMLLGCIASRWASVIDHLVSVSHDSRTVLEQYQDVCNLLHGQSTNLRAKQDTISQETDILEYLSGMLDGQIHLLWKICPALEAVAIPFWTPLFSLYLSEIEIQFRDVATELTIARNTLTVNLLREFGTFTFFMFMALVQLPTADCSARLFCTIRNLTVPSATAPLLLPKQLSSVSSNTLLRSSIKTQSFTRSMASPSSQKTVHDFTIKVAIFICGGRCDLLTREWTSFYVQASRKVHYQSLVESEAEAENISTPKECSHLYRYCITRGKFPYLSVEGPW